MKRFLFLLFALLAFNAAAVYVAFKLGGRNLQCRVLPKTCKDPVPKAAK